MARLRSQALLLVLLCLLSCASWVCSIESDSHDVRHPDIDESEFEDENVVGEEEGMVADDSESYNDEEDGEGDYPEDPEDPEEPLHSMDAEDDDDDGDVIVLTSENFEEQIAANKYVMVEFYAPWCGHCKALAPHYKEAATEMKAENVTLAKVNGDRETALAERFEVDGFPSMFFFTDGKHKAYPGERTSKGITTWIRKQIGLPAIDVASKEAAETILKENPIVGFGYFEKFEGPAYETFVSTARFEDGILFAQSSNSSVAEVFGVVKGGAAPAFTMVKEGEEERVSVYSGSFEENSVKSFAAAYQLPPVVSFAMETSGRIFGGMIKKQMMLFVTDEQYPAVKAAYATVAQAFRETLIFVHVNMSDDQIGQPMLEYFGFRQGEATVMGFYSEGDGKKCRMGGDITEENLELFSREFVADSAPLFYKSELTPKEEGPVKVVVGDTFDAVVLDESKDVLLEVYAPWCHHCKKLAPIYDRLAGRLGSITSLVVAKLDGTTNEHPKLTGVSGFPTILFYPAGDKSGQPKTVDAERSYKGLLLYLKDNAAIPFTLPPKNKSAIVDADVTAAEEKEGMEAKAEAIEEEDSQKDAKDEL